MNGRADTIFALSSGALPSAIAIVRVSGPAADAAAHALSGSLPPPRVAALRRFRAADGDPIDRGLLLRFPAGESVTGEGVAEFHLHGSRAAVARMLQLLGEMPGLRPAEPGEFSRRALANGRMDLLEAEALGSLLLAETESRRRAAMAVFDGALGNALDQWRRELLDLSARVEVLIDMDGEADVVDAGVGLVQRLVRLADDLDAAAGDRVPGEQREGVVVVIAGPPNSGKSSLLNRLVRREAAIVTSIPGTTRDVIEVTADLGAVRLRLVDTAGIRETEDLIESAGIVRARELMKAADLILWLGDDPLPSASADIVWLNPRIDLPERSHQDGRHSISTMTGEGMEGLGELLRTRATEKVRAEGIVVTERQRSICCNVASELRAAAASNDPLVQAEILRVCRLEFDRLVGRTATDDVMDAVFQNFCLGK